jgi:DNA polymerase-3 subunit chi
MVQVDFHFNAPEKWAYVGRLLRKISGQGKRTFVCGPPDALERLHQDLWHLNPSDFVTHCLVSDDVALVRHSSILLATDWSALSASNALDVGLNLHAEAPVDLGALSRLVEVVGPEESDKSSARMRWKHYAEKGFTINRFDLSAAAV